MQAIKSNSTSGCATIRLRRYELLRFLGLPYDAKKPDAHKAYKAMLIEARRANDEETQKALSAIWAYLKKRLANLCAGCGVVVSPSSRKCRLCNVTSRVVVAIAMIALGASAATNSPATIREKLLAHTNRVSPGPAIGRTNPVQVTVTINSPAANVRRILQAKTNLAQPWITIANYSTNFVYSEMPVGTKVFRAVTTNSPTVSLAWDGTGTNTTYLWYGNHSGVRSKFSVFNGSPARLALPVGTNYVIASTGTNYSNEFIAVVSPSNTFVTPKLSLK